MVDERKPHVEQRRVDRVSSAFWPLTTRKGVPTGKAAQRRRDWIMQGRWWILLIDTLQMRILLVLATLLVVGTSLLVALLGLKFWYLLPLPLALFVLPLLVPALLRGQQQEEPSAPLPLPQDMRSSAGTISRYAHELRSSAGFLSQYAHELRSSAGMLSPHAHELRSEPGLFASTGEPGLLASVNDSPATPMPVEPPLVRVLETYDLRATPFKHFLTDVPGDTAERTALRSIAQSGWNCTPHDFLQGQSLPCSQIGPDPAPSNIPCSEEDSVQQEKQQ